MTLPKICAIVSVCALAAIIVPGAGLQYAAGKGWIRQTPSLETGYKIYVLAMFCVMSFSAIGAMVGLFVHLQLKIGNQDHAMIRMLRDHQTGFILGFWGFLFLGLAVAAPAILHDMLGIRPGIGISQGVLRADIGMTIDEVAKASTLKMAPPGRRDFVGASRSIGEVVFDYEIPGSGACFESCRYYWLETGDKGASDIAAINVGISPNKMSRSEFDAFEKRVQRMLAGDGWNAMHYVWRREEDIRLAGGKTSSGDGRYSARGDTLLILETKRVDDEKPGEDPNTAGEFILYIDLRPLRSSSSDRLEFYEPGTSPFAQQAVR